MWKRCRDIYSILSCIWKGGIHMAAALEKSNKSRMSKEEKKAYRRKVIKRDKYLLIMFAPVLVYYLIFCYLPMTGLYMAFTKYKIGSGFAGIFTSPFVGLK